MDKPIKPNNEDCCNSGCNPCIFDVYEKQLKIYENMKSIDKICSVQLPLNGISQLEYKSFVIIEIIEITTSIKVIKLKKKDRKLHEKVWWKPGDHFLVKCLQKSCTRAYTPIKSKNDFHDSDFFIVLKKYDNGIVSKYLFDLNIGNETLWRGPYGSYTIDTNNFKRIIMIAQGTGVAPFMSIIESVLNNEDTIIKLLLYFCCHNIDSILFRDELYSYKAFWNFKYQIFLGSYLNQYIKYEEPIIKRKLSYKDLEDTGYCIDDQFLLCGSKLFMSEFKTCLLNKNIIPENIVLF